MFTYLFSILLFMISTIIDYNANYYILIYYFLSIYSVRLLVNQEVPEEDKNPRPSNFFTLKKI